MDVITYLSVLWLKLIHVSKMSPSPLIRQFQKYNPQGICYVVSIQIHGKQAEIII